ncbi:hypothetical protein GCM10023198_35830 [Promicromonospora umidemergens]|uniref:Uncharacterized protein n=1 Tax=Promicromonospora umidemergens TaxID=629679 RepID=A0ABP8XL65_9MICO
MSVRLSLGFGAERLTGPERVSVSSMNRIAPVLEPPAVQLRSAHPQPGDARQHVGRRSAEHDRHAQRDPPRAGQVAREELALPAAGHVDGEAGTELAVGLRLGPVRRVPVDRGGARVEPQARRSRRRGDRSVQGARRVGTGAQDLVAVRVGVPAADALAREVDQQVGAVDHARERGVAVGPPDVGTGAPDPHDVVPARREVVHQRPSDEAVPARHDSPPLIRHGGEPMAEPVFWWFVGLLNAGSPLAAPLPRR